MKFQMETFEEKKARLDRWHDFFAIFPKEVAPGDMRFFEMIERRVEWVPPKPGNPGSAYWKTRYRAKKDPFQPEAVKKLQPPRDGSMRITVGAPTI